MDIVIQSPHIRLSKRIQQIVSEKFMRLEKVTDRIIRCDVVLRREKNDKDNDFVVEAKLAVPGNDLFARKAGPKFEVAAEEVCLNLFAQLRKRKDRL